MRQGYWRLLIAGLGALMCATAIAHAADFAGVYKSSLGILTLQQNGSRVIGAFSKYDGVLEGRAEGRHLTFHWRDGFNNVGAGEAVLGEDDISLRGSTDAGKSSADAPFLATRLAEEPNPPGIVTYCHGLRD